MKRSRLLATALLSVATAHCRSSAPEPASLPAEDAGAQLDAARPPVPHSGLEQVGLVELPWDMSGAPHATRLLTDATQRAWILDTNLVIALRLPELTTDIQSEPTFAMRCPIGALGNGNVYCGSPDHPSLLVFDATNGRRRVPTTPPKPAVEPGAFDLVVGGKDRLYSATAGVGLQRLPLTSDGLPNEAARSTILEGDIEALDGDGKGRLVAFDAKSEEVLLLENEVVVRRVPVAGPAVRVQLSGDRVLAALGSQGLASIDWASGRITHQVHPQAVVTSGAFENGLLAVGTSTGLYLYDLERTLEVPIGFVPSAYGFLDVRFLAGEVVALDWRELLRFRPRRDGHVMTVDAASGYLIAPGQGIRVPVRNEGDLTLRVLGVEVPPRSIGWLESPPADGDSKLRLEGERGIGIARRTGRARLGAVVPIRTPSEFADRRVTFALPDCALQFPAWKDVRWQLAHPPAGAPTPLVVPVPVNDALVPNWAAIWSLPTPKPMSAYVDGSSEASFNALFGVTLMFGGADVEAIYDTDASGTVTNFSHQYRSIFMLPAPIVTGG